MDAEQLMKAIENGKTIKRGTTRLYRSGEWYVLIGSGFISRAKEWEINKYDETFIHFSKEGNPRFSVALDGGWKVEE